MTELTFGRFSPYRTFVHKLDPRNKIFLLILLLVAVFLEVKLYSSALIISGVLFFVLLAFMLISKVSLLSFLKSLRALWILILFLLIIYVFIPNPTYNSEHIAFHIGKFAVNYDAFIQCGYIIIRIVEMLMCTMILTSTTSPMNLTYGLEWYMSPLKMVKFPAHIIAMTLSIALRFIPTLLDEVDRIIKAQSSRGVDFQHGGLGKKFRAIISLIIPLFVSAINRSEELSNAMEARGYDPYAKRSRYRTLSFSWRDLIAFIVAGVVFAAVLYLFIYDKNIAQVDIIYWIFHVKVGF